MDFDQTLEWHLQIRTRHRMPLEAAEFGIHGGRAFYLEWRAHPADPSMVKLEVQRLVEERFTPVAERMIKIVDRYYDELSFKQPSDGFHWENVKHALALATGCLRAASQWFDGCTAPQMTVAEIFVGVRNAIGALATSPDRVCDVMAEANAEATLQEMNERRRRANCAGIRIVA